MPTPMTITKYPMMTVMSAALLTVTWVDSGVGDGEGFSMFKAEHLIYDVTETSPGKPDEPPLSTSQSETVERQAGGPNL